MTDIAVNVIDAQAININVGQSQPISLSVSDAQPISVSVEDSSPINVKVADAQPINVKLADVVRVDMGGGSDKHFTYQFTNSAELTVLHELNKRPAVSIEDSAGDEVEAEVEYINLDSLLVRFSAPFTGRVICN